MKTIKPQKLGLLTKVFEDRRQPYLVVTALGLYRFDRGGLGSEVEMWTSAGADLGPMVPLDLCMPKPTGEVLVCGRGYPRDRTPWPAVSVRVQIGSVDKTLWVVGDRRWSLGAPGDPEPFTEMPITYSNAFGGPGFAENPIGKGIATVQTGDGEVRPMPNIEDPDHLLRATGDRPKPAGFGAYDITWPQRATKLGTYDAKWLEERFPGFAADFDIGYFNSAPADQQIEGWFVGDETFTLEHMHPDKPVIEGKLPGLRARVLVNRKKDGIELEDIATRLETVHFFPHRETAILLYRGVLKIDEDDASDVIQIVAGFEAIGEPKEVAHYEEVLTRRLDRKRGHLYSLKDSELLPLGIPAEALAEPTEREGLLKKNLRRKLENELERAREHIRRQGLDPAEHMPVEAPPPAPPPTADTLSTVVEDVDELMRTQRAEIEKQIADAETQARRECSKNGLDYDSIVAEQKKKGGGPPKFTAKAELERLREQVVLSERVGVPLPQVDAMLADPALATKLLKAERMMRDAYRRFAHAMTPASAREEGESKGAREEATAAREAGESLADRDFTGVDFSKLDLRGVNLQGSFLEAADLSGADLRGADLSTAVLTRANLTGANLAGCKLIRTNLGGANLTKADLTGGVDLTGAVLAKADLTGATLTGAKLERADFSEAVLMSADLSDIKAARVLFMKTNLDGLVLRGADLEKCTFLEGSAKGADFSSANLTGAVFVGTNGDGAIFRGAKLENIRVVKEASFERADFSGAHADRAFFRGAKLKGSDFRRARLIASDFSEADLREAKLERAIAGGSLFIKTDLTGADLRCADLPEAILQRAIIKGANLEDANLFRADMMRVVVDGGTITKGANLKSIRFVDVRRPDEQG